MKKNKSKIGIFVLLTVIVLAVSALGAFAESENTGSSGNSSSGGGGGSSISGSVVTPACDYTLSDLHLEDLAGNPIADDPEGSCMAAVDITKNSITYDTPYVIITAYTKSNKLIAFSFMRHYLDKGESTMLSTLINLPEGESMGIVKAYVWNSFASMTPLSNELTLIVNEPDTPSTEEPDTPADDENTYVAYGYIIETYKTDNTLSADEVTIEFNARAGFEKGDYTKLDIVNYVDDIITHIDITTMTTDGTDYSKYRNVYSKITFATEKIDGVTFYKLKEVTESSLNSHVTLDSAMVDADDYCFSIAANGNYIRYYASESAQKSTKYKLADTFELYVNGVMLDNASSNYQTYLVKYLITDAKGNVELIDTFTASNGADGYYDIIRIETYATAMVASVDTASNKITFSQNTTDIKSTITLDTEDNEYLVYNIYLNGEKIELADLRENDVLSIAYDVNVGFTYSDFYDIYVSRKTDEGRMTEMSSVKQTIKLNGSTYGFVDYSSLSASLAVGNYYKLYIDAFNRIFSAEVSRMNDKYAFVVKYADSISGLDDYKRITIYTTDGASEALQVDDEKVKVYEGATLKTFDSTNTLAAYLYAKEAETDLSKRVVRYKVSESTGYIVELTFLDGKASCTDAYGCIEQYEFKSRNNSVGVVKMDNNTYVLNTIKYDTRTNDPSKLSMTSLDYFIDGLDYAVYGYGDKYSDGAYPFVLIQIGAPLYNVKTNLAVVKNAAEVALDVYYMDILYNGDAQQLTISDAVIVNNGTVDGLRKGDVIVFGTDSNGYADQIDVLIKADDIAVDNYSSFLTAVMKQDAWKSFTTLPSVVDALSWTKDWNGTNVDKNGSVQIVAGPIVNAASNYFTIGAIDSNGKTDLVSGVLDIDTTADTNVYVYDYAQARGRELYAVNVSDIYKSCYIEENDVIDWTAEGNLDTVNYAIAMVVDGEARDVYYFEAK